MNQEAIDQLLQILASLSCAAMEDRHTLRALLVALEEQNPEIYRAYQRNLGEAHLRSPDLSQIAIVLEQLRAVLQKS